MNIYVDATQRYVASGYGDDEGVDIDAQAYSAQQEVQGVEEGTGLYTGRNTSKTTYYNRALREALRKYVLGRRGNECRPGVD